MSIQVNNFDVHKAEEELKNCPKIVRDYVKLLKESLDMKQQLVSKAIGKLRENAVLSEDLPPCSKCDMPSHPVFGALCLDKNCINKKK